MRRRDFITLIGGAAAGWPIAARGQHAEQMRRIGVLMSLAADDQGGKHYLLDSVTASRDWDGSRAAPSTSIIALLGAIPISFHYSQKS